MIGLLRVAAVAALLLAVGFLVCPGLPTGDPAALVKDSLNGRQRPFRASCVLSSSGKSVHFSIRGDGGRLSDCLRSYVPTATPNRRSVMQALEDAASGTRYELLLEGHSRIAGRRCSTVRLKPPSKQDEWFQVWIDPDSHLVLAWRHWRYDGKLISSMQTTRLLNH